MTADGADDQLEIEKLFQQVEEARDAFHLALTEFRTTPLSLVAHHEFRTMNSKILALPTSLRESAIEKLLKSIRQGHIYFNSLPPEDADMILDRIRTNWLNILTAGIQNVTIQELVDDAERGYRERQEGLRHVTRESSSSSKGAALLRAGEALTGAGLIAEDVLHIITTPNPAKITSVFAGLAMFWRGVRG